MGEGALFPGGGHGLPSGIWPHTTDLTQLLKHPPADSADSLVGHSGRDEETGPGRKRALRQARVGLDP